MTTTSYKKAISSLIWAEKTDRVTITWKDFNGVEIATHKCNMKAWEALNLLETINKIAFIRLSF